MWLNHYLIHTKIERQQYLPHRKNEIKKLWPHISSAQLDELAKITRGRAKQDFVEAVEHYKKGEAISAVPHLRSNTCLTHSGYWCEHLLTKTEYATIIKNAGFKFEYTGGYWDTHYNSSLMNIIGNTMNGLIKVFGKFGYVLSPFVNIVAYGTDDVG
jgi:hypothetical protein